MDFKNRYESGRRKLMLLHFLSYLLLASLVVWKAHMWGVIALIGLGLAWNYLRKILLRIPKYTFSEVVTSLHPVEWMNLDQVLAQMLWEKGLPPTLSAANTKGPGTAWLSLALVLLWTRGIVDIRTIPTADEFNLDQKEIEIKLTEKGSKITKRQKKVSGAKHGKN